MLVLGTVASQNIKSFLPTPSFESIATSTANGAGYLSFTDIPQTYTNLQLRYMTRNNASAGTTDQILMWFNGNQTAANYRTHYLWGNGTAAETSTYTGLGYVRVGMCPASGANAAIWGVGIVDILDYTNTSKNKTVKNFWGHDQNGSGTIAQTSGLWVNTAAITSINVAVSGYYEASGATWGLYGIK
jgi:hypothetical protein